MKHLIERPGFWVSMNSIVGVCAAHNILTAGDSTDIVLNGLAVMAATGMLVVHCFKCLRARKCKK